MSDTNSTADLRSTVAGKPGAIETKSMATITAELGEKIDRIDPKTLSVVKRVIHTTADFSFADTLTFAPGPEICDQAKQALAAGGVTIVTDTNMARSGISRPALAKLGCSCACYMADEDVAAAARANGTTRAVACIDKACSIEGPIMFAIGNAPTALFRIKELVEQGRFDPLLVVGVPVGFVNVVEAKEALLETSIPAIVARGRKGGSTVAAAIMNALLYGITRTSEGSGARA
ncbi:precorrin-8X methylmutase [Paratractidigestivibacter sp.]|uniref:precorrin-8X methylmutase n=1 Tax=Paratractidigestivibacter sp. TaxID=2847316 RepID=UPI002AC9AD0A|nr:precorrin-8X methylmutase [Paratractidigestivibacter sp.]